MPVGNILILFADKYLDKKIASSKIDILTERPLIKGLFTWSWRDPRYM